MIGLSVGPCFADMAAGSINYRMVNRIISGALILDSNVEDHISRYRTREWRENPDQAELLFRYFWETGRVDIPRSYLRAVPFTIQTGHWVDSATDIHWLKEKDAMKMTK